MKIPSGRVRCPGCAGTGTQSHSVYPSSRAARTTSTCVRCNGAKTTPAPCAVCRASVKSAVDAFVLGWIARAVSEDETLSVLCLAHSKMLFDAEVAALHAHYKQPAPLLPSTESTGQ